MRHTTIAGWALGVGASAILLGKVLWPDTAEHTNTEINALKNDLLALQQQRQQPKVVVREIHRIEVPTENENTDPSEVNPDTLTSAALGPDSIGAAEPDLGALSLEEREYRSGIVMQQKVEALERSYDEEPDDPEWSEAATGMLLTTYAGEDFSALSTTTECRATLCRVDFSYSEPEGALQYRRLSEMAPWPAVAFHKVNTETQQGFMYLAREGFELPLDDSSAMFN